MQDLSAFPIATRWPARHPERLQLYSLPTPNGVKVSIMLEEIGLQYEPHLVDIGKNESWTPEFLSLNPHGKLLPAGAAPLRAIQWVIFQTAGVGPMFGQVGYFNKFAGKEIADKRPLQRYVDESKRLLAVLETRLVGRR